MFSNAAIFINGVRRIRNVNVSWDDETVSIINRSNKQVMETYTIEEVASTNPNGGSMAWDIRDGRGDLVRLVAQTGCGCSGMKPYEFDAEYSMTLDRK